MTKFVTSIDLSLPFAIYKHKKEECQMFAQGQKAALNCGGIGMELALHEWIGRLIGL
jgi:hypothetical protein